MSQDASILSDTNLWYGVAVFLFFAIIYKTSRKSLVAALDGQIAKIKGELDEAKRLRAEAEATLADYRVRQEEALREAETIVADAKALAAKLRKESEIELEETLRRHEQMAIERIQSIQEEFVGEVRAHMIDTALSEARGKLAKDAGGDEAAKLIDKVIAFIPSLSGGKVA